MRLALDTNILAYAEGINGIEKRDVVLDLVRKLPQDLTFALRQRGLNVGVPAPMAWFPFTGWNQSFFGDLHIQGTESIHFYTRQKMTLTRWFQSEADSHHDPVWKTGKK